MSPSSGAGVVALPRRTWRRRPRWVRWSAYACFAAVLLVLAGGVAAVRTVRSSFPLVDGTLDVPGLDAQVRVLRDTAGVPQVYASTPHDLFLAQGFVQAQDRFWQMDVRRHRAAGRLSELFGPETVEEDKVARALGWRRVAEQEVARLDAGTRAALDAFSAGVNAYLRERSTTRLSLEYSLLALGGLDYTPARWTAADSLSWLKVMAWDRRVSVQEEVDRALESTRLDRTEIAELYPDSPEGAGDDGPTGNAWVVSGDLTSTGSPLLANDPHGTTAVPGEWQQMGLHCTTYDASCPYDVSGFTTPGVPGVVIGHNRDVAWGMTDARADTADLYLEGVEGERYRRGGRWVPFERRQETIRVAGEDAVTFTVRSTVHGPVLSDLSRTYATVGANAPDGGYVPVGGDAPPGPYAVSLAWTALRPDRTAASVLAMDRATDSTSFRAALRGFAAPVQYVVYADRAGRVGRQVAGRLPQRRTDVGTTGAYPLPGWRARFDWEPRPVPFAQLDSELDPADGVLVAGDDRGYRSQRIRARIEAMTDQGKVTAEQMGELQLDSHSSFGPVIVPYLVDLGVGGPYYSAGKRLLERWDFEQPRASPAAAYFNAVWRNLLRLTFADDLPASVPIDGGERWYDVVRSILDDPTSHWWDDRSTPEVEQRDQVLREAMREARDELTRLQSRRAARWTWGHQHTLTLENRTLGRTGNGLERWLLDRGEWRVAGGNGAVDATEWDAREGYEVVSAPSMRMVVSLGDLDGSTWVNQTGASGHAFSSHYTDQTNLWAAGKTRRWPFGADAVRRSTADTLVLKPAEAGGTD